MTEPFRVDVAREGKTTRVTATGDLDAGTADRLRSAVAGASGPRGPVVVDLADVTFVDSTGLRCILLIVALATRAHVPLEIVPSESIRRLFALAGIPPRWPEGT